MNKNEVVTCEMIVPILVVGCARICRKKNESFMVGGVTCRVGKK